MQGNRIIMAQERMSPEEVFSAIYADWKAHEISVDKAAELLKYKSRQTIYNISSKKAYMTPEQAFRFRSIFGYSLEFLTSGRGSLRTKYNVAAQQRFDISRKDALIQIASAIITNSGSAPALKAWASINNYDLDGYLSSMRELLIKNTGAAFPGQDLEPIAKIACSKNASELIERVGYINSDPRPNADMLMKLQAFKDLGLSLSNLDNEL